MATDSDTAIEAIVCVSWKGAPVTGFCCRQDTFDLLDIDMLGQKLAHQRSEVVYSVSVAVIVKGRFSCGKQGHELKIDVFVRTENFRPVVMIGSWRPFTPTILVDKL